MGRRRIPAFDVMRSVAAAAVVLVHALGPYRTKLHEVPDWDWASAVALNGALRWTVPVFIMITGALMLSDPRPFEFRYYLERRIAKVLIPFLAFSCLYAVVAGVSTAGFDGDATLAALRALPTHETFYHLGFFYYFIPLYFVIPLLSPLIALRGVAVVLVCGWLVLGTLRLAGVSGPWDVDPVMFGGYLVLGYVLWRFRWPSLGWLAVIAAIAVVVTDWYVIEQSFAAGRYRIGQWFSYKTINTAVTAAFVFVACIALCGGLRGRAETVFALVGKHSLGIYLLHPLFLWPARAFDLYTGPALVAIVCWAVVAGSLALLSSVLLSRFALTRWLVP